MDNSNSKRLKRWIPHSLEPYSKSEIVWSFWLIWVIPNESPTSFSLSKGLQQDVVPQHQTNRCYSSYLWYLSKLRFLCHIYYLTSEPAILFKHIAFFHNHSSLLGLKLGNIPHSLNLYYNLITFWGGMSSFFTTYFHLNSLLCPERHGISVYWRLFWWAWAERSGCR